MEIELVASDEILGHAHGIALDYKRNIYLTMALYNGLIYQIGERTNHTLKILAGSGGDWGRVLQNPMGIKVDSSGNIFVAELEKTRIVKFPIIL